MNWGRSRTSYKTPYCINCKVSVPSLNCPRCGRLMDKVPLAEQRKVFRVPRNVDGYEIPDHPVSTDANIYRKGRKTPIKEAEE